MAAASLIGAAPVAAKRDGRAGFLDLRLYPGSQPARADLSGCRHATLFSVPLLFSRFAQNYRQSRHFRKRIPAAIPWNGFRSDPLPAGLVLYLSCFSFDKWLVQTASQRKEGTSGRAHAAPSALPALWAGAAVPAAPFRPYRDRPSHCDDDRRAGADWRVHRRCLRFADLAG